MDSREALIALNMIEGVGPVRTRSLLEHFGEAPKILAASAARIQQVRNIGEETAARIAASVLCSRRFAVPRGSGGACCPAGCLQQPDAGPAHGRAD